MEKPRRRKIVAKLWPFPGPSPARDVRQPFFSAASGRTFRGERRRLGHGEICCYTWLIMAPSSKKNKGILGLYATYQLGDQQVTKQCLILRWVRGSRDAITLASHAM